MLASSHGFAWRPASIAVRSPRRVLTLPYSSASCDDHLEAVIVRFLFHPLSRHCFGAIAAPGACGASALPLAPFRFWLPRAGSPRKAASGLGSRAHSLPGARDRRAEQEKRMYLNRITLIGFLGGDAPKRRSATQRTSRCSRWRRKRRGRTTPEHGNPARTGIDVSPSGGWLNSSPLSPRAPTLPSRANCVATNTSARSLSAPRRHRSRSESGKSASTPF